MKRITLALQSWQANLADGLEGSIIPRGVAFLLGLLIVLRIARLVNPSYAIAPVAGVLSVAIVLQPLCYFFLRRGRVLVPLGWLLLVSDVVVVALLVYFTGGVESIFFWAYLLIILWWGYKAGLAGAAIAGAISLASFWLFIGLELYGALPHYQRLPMAASFYQNRPLVGAIIALYSLTIPLVVYVGTYLSSIRLRRSSRAAYLEGVQAFVEAVEAKDPHTKGHSERVAHYAVLIAQELGLKKNEVKLIKDAGLVHDVGKIFLPEEVL
ncbi:MAG: HD-GYP domain-containing protein, partial [Dehalococcoidia bacterium]